MSWDHAVQIFPWGMLFIVILLFRPAIIRVLDSLIKWRVKYKDITIDIEHGIDRAQSEQRKAIRFIYKETEDFALDGRIQAFHQVFGDLYALAAVSPRVASSRAWAQAEHEIRVLAEAQGIDGQIDLEEILDELEQILPKAACAIVGFLDLRLLHDKMIELLPGDLPVDLAIKYISAVADSISTLHLISLDLNLEGQTHPS